MTGYWLSVDVLALAGMGGETVDFGAASAGEHAGDCFRPPRLSVQAGSVQHLRLGERHLFPMAAA